MIFNSSETGISLVKYSLSSNSRGATSIAKRHKWLSLIALLLSSSVGPSYAMDASLEALLRENAALKKEIQELRSAVKTNKKQHAISSKSKSDDIPSRALGNKVDETQFVNTNIPAWAGGYVGLTAGYTIGASDNASNKGWANPDINPYSLAVFLYGAPEVATAQAIANSGQGRGISQSGFIGGGQIGYNFNLGQHMLMGLEGDIQGAGIRGTGNANGIGPVTGNITSNAVQAGVDWLGTVRGRVGYQVIPNALVYGTAGLSYGEAFLNTAPISSEIGPSYSQNSPVQWTQNSSRSVRVGWVAGAGSEWMLSQNWSVKGEALYYDLGNMSVTNTQFYAGSNNLTNSYPSLVGGSTITAHYTGIIARLGVNYHLNPGSNFIGLR